MESGHVHVRSKKLTAAQRISTPAPFAELLIAMAESALVV
jgi:hypothetical protein